MNRRPVAAIARDVAEFLIANHIDPLDITVAQYDALKPPYTSYRLKIYFLTFTRAMKHIARQVERLNSNKVEVLGKRTVAKKAVKAKEKLANGEV